MSVVVAAYQQQLQGFATPPHGRSRLATRNNGSGDCNNKIRCFLQLRQQQRGFVDNDDGDGWWMTTTSKNSRRRRRRRRCTSITKLSSNDDSEKIYDNVEDRRQEETMLQSPTTTSESSYSSNNNDDEFDSLDVMLNRARKRPTNRIYQLQVFLDVAAIQFPSPWGRIVFTMSDILLVGVSSIILDAYGFAIGLLIGKLTIRPVLKFLQPSPAVSILLVPSWTVIWAIVLDQIL